MFRRILVPVDGSTFAEHALPYAAQAAGMAGSELNIALVHVPYSPASTDMVQLNQVESWEAENREREAAYVGRLAERMKRDYGVPTTPHLLSGEIVPALSRLAKQLGAELVVLTTHGRSGMDRAWMGSVADGLVRELEMPVLLIRPSDEEPAAHTDSPEYHHVVIALDGSARAERSIRPALTLAGAYARVTLLRVVSPPAGVTSPFLPHAVAMTHEREEEMRREAETYLERTRDSLSTDARSIKPAVVLDYNEARGILTYAADNGVDLIALGTHGRNPVVRLVLGSISDKVVRAATVPVLIC